MGGGTPSLTGVSDLTRLHLGTAHKGYVDQDSDGGAGRTVGLETAEGHPPYALCVAIRCSWTLKEKGSGKEQQEGQERTRPDLSRLDCISQHSEGQ